MGISKAMMEKVAVAKSRESVSTSICVTRYGNVLASRGSVIPLFVNQIRAGKALTITDPNMTRFMMTLGEAVDLVLFAFEHGQPGDIFVQKSPTANLDTLAKALISLLGVSGQKVRILGTRHGEKLFETLLSREEMFSAQDLGDYFRVPPDLRDLNYSKYMDQGETQISEAVDYNSHNASQLNVDEMKALLMKLPFMQAVIRGGDAQAEE
jgi:UDP-glucose 4-epimerase